MEERKGKRIRSEEDPPRSSDKRRKTRKKEDENVLSRRGSSSSEGRRRGRDMDWPKVSSVNFLKKTLPLVFLFISPFVGFGLVMVCVFGNN